MKIFLDMIGCRLNQAEIETMAMEFIQQGDEVVAEAQLADLIIINTCCVTAKAEAESRKMMRMYQRSFPARVVITGCWPSVNNQEAKSLAGPANVFLNSAKGEIVKTLRADSIDPDTLSATIVKPDLGSRNRTRAFIKVQDGCDNGCTYCLTRIARGRSVSRPEEEILRHIRGLESLGVKEVVLSGVQLGSWGKDFPIKARLAGLLHAILDETTIARIRLSSIEPWDVDESLLECWQNPRLCPHLHLPLQSGNDETLKQMARPTNTARYANLVETLRREIPGIAITTDVIVGFPGESDEAFRQSFDFIQSLEFSGGHVFKFSAMPGTPAFSMGSQTPESIKQLRSQSLRDYFEQAVRNHSLSKIDSLEEVLWESADLSKSTPIFSGLTRDYVRVFCQTDLPWHNTFQKVRIIGFDDESHLISVPES